MSKKASCSCNLAYGGTKRTRRNAVSPRKAKERSVRGIVGGGSRIDAVPSTMFRFISPVGARLIFDVKPGKDLTDDTMKAAMLASYPKCIKDSAAFGRATGADLYPLVDEMCIVNGASHDRDLLLKPIGPASGRRWLSNIDIAAVMRPMEHYYADIGVGPRLKWFGPYTRDFAELKCDIADTSIEQLVADKYTHIATIVNYDSSRTSGSHWVAIVVVIPRNFILSGNKDTAAKIYFWDSTGYELPPDPSEYEKGVKKGDNPILRYLLKTAKELKSLGLDVATFGNKMQHQRKNTECGVYCILFVNAMLKGMDFEDFVARGDLGDDEVQRLRSVLFRER